MEASKPGGSRQFQYSILDIQYWILDIERLRVTGKRRWVIYVSPEDIHEVHRHLQGAGYEVSDIERTSYDTEECYLEDPDGYELWVSAPVQSE